MIDSNYQALLLVEQKLLASRCYEATEKFLQGEGRPEQLISLSKSIEL